MSSQRDLTLPEYTLRVSAQDFLLIFEQLGEVPAKRSRYLLNSLEQQVLAQQDAAVKTEEAAPAPAEPQVDSSGGEVPANVI